MKIQISQGSVLGDDISQKHLVTNHLIDPKGKMDKLIMYAETRYLMTILTSGVRDGNYAFRGYLPSSDGKTIKTVVKQVPQGEMLDDIAWQWRVMGRIQKESRVAGNAAVGTPTAGTSTSGGYFFLHMEDDTLKNQMVCIFPSQKMARVLGEPSRVASNKFLYKFQTFANETFSFDTWFLGNAGKKTVFGGYSSVGERSRRGYATFHFPDKYIQHGTKQRKSFSISGDANVNNVVWYQAGDAKGYVYEGEQQVRAQFLMEDEFQKWEGKSTMRDAYGNLLAFPSQYDEFGEPVIAGDGLIEQISGANDLEASGAFGLPTWDDFTEWVKMSKKKRDDFSDEPIIIVTGSDGITHVDNLAMEMAKSLNVQIVVTGNGEGQTLGYKFRKFKVAGETIHFVENPMFNDEMRYPAKLHTGSGSYSVKGSTFYLLDFSSQINGRSNVEIRAFGRAGINRNMYYAWFPGFTGREDVKPMTPVDQDEFHMFKHNALAAYKTESCGVLTPNMSFAG